MLRIISLIGVGFVLISNTLAQTPALPRPYNGLSGLIHTVREESYNCNGDPAEKPWRVNEVTYDRRGNETWRAYYNADGSVGHQASYTYDKDGNNTGWAEFYGKSELPPAGLRKHADFKMSGGKVISAVVYKEETPEFRTTRNYDERGNMIREVSVEIGFSTTSRSFKYDLQNRLIESTYDSSGLSSIKSRNYDTAGNVIKETWYDKGLLTGTTTRVFEGSRLIKETATSSDGRFRTNQNTYSKSGKLILTTIDDSSITSTTTIEYYDNGKMRSKDQVTVAKAGGMRQGSEDSPTPGRILEKYDIRGNQIERYVYDDKGSLYLTQLSAYDDLGKQIGLTESSRLGPMYSHDLVYEHDSKGNRIATLCRTVTAAGEVKLAQQEKRTITYYDN